jgi:hypothetical protein
MLIHSENYRQILHKGKEAHFFWRLITHKKKNCISGNRRIESTQDSKEDQVAKGSRARLLRLRVVIQQGAWASVSCESCVLSGTGLCDEPIPRPEESYGLWCVLLVI